MYDLTTGIEAHCLWHMILASCFCPSLVRYANFSCLHSLRFTGPSYKLLAVVEICINTLLYSAMEPRLGKCNKCKWYNFHHINFFFIIFWLHVGFTGALQVFHIPLVSTCIILQCSYFIQRRHTSYSQLYSDEYFVGLGCLGTPSMYSSLHCAFMVMSLWKHLQSSTLLVFTISSSWSHSSISYVGNCVCNFPAFISLELHSSIPSCIKQWISPSLVFCIFVLHDLSLLCLVYVDQSEYSCCVQRPLVLCTPIHIGDCHHGMLQDGTQGWWVGGAVE